MDRIDIKILNILQKDASLPLATIAKKVDLSAVEESVDKLKSLLLEVKSLLSASFTSFGVSICSQHTFVFIFF